MSVPWLMVREHGVELRVRVVPRASRDRACGSYGDRLKIQLTAPPVGNAANDSLVRLIARAAGVAPARVRVVLGERGRSKVVFIAQPNDPAALAGRLEAMLGGSAR